MITNWGYSIDELEDILTESEFEIMTAGRFSGDERTKPMLQAAGSAVRNYCGWHVYPSAVCRFETRAHDRRVTFCGGDTLIQLPARNVTAVNSVRIGDTELSDFSFDPSGLLRIYDTIAESRRDVIAVEYVAGLSDELADGIKEVVSVRVTHGLANSYGVQSEAAGGVSVTYSAGWLNTASASSLTNTNREALEPYRLMGVF